VDGGKFDTGIRGSQWRDVPKLYAYKGLYYAAQFQDNLTLVDLVN